MTEVPGQPGDAATDAEAEVGADFDNAANAEETGFPVWAWALVGGGVVVVLLGGTLFGVRRSRRRQVSPWS